MDKPPTIELDYLYLLADIPPRIEAYRTLFNLRPNQVVTDIQGVFCSLDYPRDPSLLSITTYARVLDFRLGGKRSMVLIATPIPVGPLDASLRPPELAIWVAHPSTAQLLVRLSYSD